MLNKMNADATAWTARWPLTGTMPAGRPADVEVLAVYSVPLQYARTNPVVAQVRTADGSVFNVRLVDLI